MRPWKNVGLLAVAVAALLLWAETGAGAHLAADEPNYQDQQATTTGTSLMIQYQAWLTEPSTGEPVADGTYTMVLRLYSVATEGTALWTETKDVPVQAGLFSTALGDTTPLSQDILNGQQLWLGITVGADAEAAPRQPVRPAAYAIGLVPGAIVETNSGLPVLSVHNTGAGEALHVEGAASIAGNLTITGTLTGGTHEHSGDDITSGTVAEPRIDTALTRDSEVMSHVLAGDGSGSGLDADLLDGQQASAFASSTHEHSGDDITSGTVAEPRIDAALTRDSEVMSHVLAGDGSGSGLDADLLDGQQASAFAAASHTHWGASWSGAGTGLYLSSSNDIGLNSNGGWYGVWGDTDTGTAGVLGYFTASTGGGRGVWGYANSSQGTGVRGDAAASSGTTYGVYGRSNSPDGYGVFGSTDDNHGVYGEAFATSGTNFGIYGRSHSTSGRGVWGWASANSGSGIGVGGGTMVAGGYGLYTGNNLYVGGSCVGCTSVFIATNAGQKKLLVGEAVVAIGVGPLLLGHSAPVLQVRRATPDDASVLGVVYRRGEFYAASDDQPEVGDIVQPGDGDVAPGDYLMVITSGLGQVRVDPGLGALAPGQSLTVAGVAGRVTAAGADTVPDLLFAQAVETEPDADGLLWALIGTR